MTAKGWLAAAAIAVCASMPMIRAQSRTARAAADEAGDWPTYNRTLMGDRFSPLNEITTANVAGLRPVCTFDTGEQVSFEAGPVVVAGVMYVSTDTFTYAVDAATCAMKWKVQHSYGTTSLAVSRGVAVDDGRVFRGAVGGHVIALDAASGRQLWDVSLSPSPKGMTMPMAPIAWNGRLFIGNAGGDVFGVTGHVWALDEQTGRTVWRFDSVPESGPARATWQNAPGVPPTGGGFWTTFALDTARGVLVVPAGNPAPDFVPELRPGENLYTNSIIAIDARSGRLVDYLQLVKHDFHDWDVDAGPALVTSRGGRELVASANKDGLLSVIDRSKGKFALLFQTPTTTRENVDVPLSPDHPTRFCPGAQGGSEWNGPAYDRTTNLLLVNATDWCATVQQARADALKGTPGTSWSGATVGFGTMDPIEKRQGWLTAIDADQSTVRWKYRSALPMLSGVTPTAGGLVFTGELSGDAIALDVASGRVLWRHATGNAIGGGVVTYRAGGRQLVAVVAGFKSRIWPAPGDGNRVVVFGLR
jgi:alcohol dehydrogenase (cytochrome c)